MQTATITPRLRQAAPGQVVKLKGVDSWLYAGKPRSDGYVPLFRTETAEAEGADWSVMASPGHVVTYIGDEAKGGAA